MSKSTIDPNAKASAKDGIYGLPFKEKDSKVIYIPIPWDVTTSYQAGTANGPEAILQASPQIDFFDLDFIDAYQAGLFMLKPDAKIKRLGIEGRKLAKKIIDADDEQIKKSKVLKDSLTKVNQLSDQLNDYVYKTAKKYLDNNQIPVFVGGDHSTPFGAIKAYAEKYKNFGVLHFDAHSDTRFAYMGFNHSHASIMFNVMDQIKGVNKLVQVGIRDFCEQEYDYTKANKKIDVYFDQHLQKRKLSGENFASIAKEIVAKLPENIYISFDIDGLDPRYCPHTGTPVPGGLEYHEVLCVINEIINQKKKLVGFDLVEVAPNPKNKHDEWDANVGMRLLYKMTGASLYSHGLIKRR